MVSATAVDAPALPDAAALGADSVRTRAVVPGVAHHVLWYGTAPWVVHVLDVRLDRCLTATAVKGFPGAEGRATTSALLSGLAQRRAVIGGVNADFFTFTPPGVPTNVHVEGGRVVTPPNGRPAFAIDSAGRPAIVVFSAPGLDRPALDDPRLATVRLAPFHPREAVGGRPALVRDSAIVPAVDTDGQAGFAGSRHPRTAVGVGDGGRRLLLVVVDGRQPGYSAGMTLRELAALFLRLGVPSALNLDGGGSTTLVARAPDGTQRVLNRPSDPTGERPVGNALAVVRACP